VYRSAITRDKQVASGDQRGKFSKVGFEYHRNSLPQHLLEVSDQFLLFGTDKDDGPYFFCSEPGSDFDEIFLAPALSAKGIKGQV